VTTITDDGDTKAAVRKLPENGRNDTVNRFNACDLESAAGIDHSVNWTLTAPPKVG
jgi:hypothetical protein